MRINLKELKEEIEREENARRSLPAMGTVSNRAPSGWTASKAEEAIAVLYLIAALIAFHAGFWIVGGILSLKFALGFMFSIIEAFASQGTPVEQK